MSKTQNTVDFMVVGQGLAGSLLSWALIQQGARVMVVDNHHQHSSSLVAAGMINPITGHRLNITDNIDRFMPSAKHVYSTIEQQLNVTLLTSIQQLRLIKKPGQLDYWHQRQQQASHRPYLGQLHASYPAFRQSAHGIAEIKQSYRVDTVMLLSHLRHWLMDQQSLKAECFQYDALTPSETHIEYQDIRAQGIIFCEGFQAIHNPWWQHLPFKLAKGEIISLTTNDLPHKMFNWGHWLLPISSPTSPQTETTYKLGANYAWDNLSLTPDTRVRQDLLNSMQQYVRADATITNHQVGIRPTTLYRQAFVGTHPEHPRLFCFNGFGSKGCLTIPYHADLLTQHLLAGASLPSVLTQHL